MGRFFMGVSNLLGCIIYIGSRLELRFLKVLYPYVAKLFANLRKKDIWKKINNRQKNIHFNTIFKV